MIRRLAQPYLKKADGPRVTDRELIVFILCVLVTTVGLSADIARHVQNPGNLGGDFLSGWHLVLYGGVAAVGVFIGVGALRRGPSYVGAVGTGTLGFLLLGFGGFADAAWHKAFGTEAEIEALVSPPHLLVFGGLGFLITAPIVVLWDRREQRLGWIASVAAETSMISMVLITSLFTGYLSPLSGGLELVPGYVEPVVGELRDVSSIQYDQVRGLGIIVWTAFVFSAAHSLVMMRFRLKPGVMLLGWCVLAVPPLFLATGESVHNLCVGMIAAGVVVELSRAFGRPVHGRLAMALTCAAFNATLWGVTFAALNSVHRLGYGTHLWTGAIMISAMVGAATAGLVGVRIPTTAELDARPADAPLVPSAPAPDPVAGPPSPGPTRASTASRTHDDVTGGPGAATPPRAGRPPRDRTRRGPAPAPVAPSPPSPAGDPAPGDDIFF